MARYHPVVQELLPMVTPQDEQFQVDVRHVFDESPLAILIVGEGGRIEYANRAATQRYGYSNNELLLMVVEQLAPPWLQQAVQGRLETGASTGEFFEWTHRTKAGVDTPVEIHTQPIRFQGRKVRLATIRDLTARRAIVESSRLQSAIVDTMAHGIVLTSVQTTRLVHVNAVFASMLGYDPAELVGQHVSVINAPTDKTPEQVASDINLALLRDGHWSGDVKNQRKDGSALWCHYMVTTFDHWQHGPVWVGVCTDVTRDRETRLKRDQALIDLERAVKDKEALIREVHHRVKNNLQVVASLLRMEFAKSTVGETREALNGMQRRITAMALLHESLYRSKNLATVQLGEYVHELAQKTFMAHALQPDTVDLHVAAVKVMLEQDDAIPIGLILNEWVSNTLKHAFPDGRRGSLHVSLVQVSDTTRYCLSVSDTGIGYPADFGAKRESALGMRLVDALSAQIDGTLETSSEGGTGTTSRLWFDVRPRVVGVT